MDPNQDPALDALVKAKASRHEAPAELRERIAAALTRSGSMASQRAAAGAPWRQWLNMGVAFACGLIASVAVMQFFPMADEQDRLAQEVVSGHVRSLMAAHLADVASTDQHSVKPWFAGKLDFSPPVFDLASEGFPLAGGRLDYIEQRPVAALVYQHGQHTINLFIWPADRNEAQWSATRQGYHLLHWTRDAMGYWAVSDLNPVELAQFRDALLRARP